MHLQHIYVPVSYFQSIGRRTDGCREAFFQHAEARGSAVHVCYDGCVQAWAESKTQS